MQESELTKDQKIANYENWIHIHHVQVLIRIMLSELSIRALKHDHTKMVDPELSILTEHAKALSAVEYGGDEYMIQKSYIKAALDHHYENNRHHPEHFPDGIAGMNLVDVVEMYCDWVASAKRSKNGNVEQSLLIQKKRFNISDQLFSIMMNTTQLFDIPLEPSPLDK